MQNHNDTLILLRMKGSFRLNTSLPSKLISCCLVTKSCLTLCEFMNCRLHSPCDFPGRHTGASCHFLLRGIFPTQGSNPGLLHCRQILYQLIHQGSPRILEWVAYPFSRGIFLTQESNWGLLHCWQILYQLSYQGSP